MYANGQGAARDYVWAYAWLDVDRLSHYSGTANHWKEIQYLQPIALWYSFVY
jgi:hypothetical protein